MNMKVLIVDDEYYARKVLITMLSEWDPGILIVGEAQTGLEALECIKNEIPEVIFADIRMPELDGLELAKIVGEQYPSIFLVIISGYADFNYAQKALDYGVREYLLKPVKESELQKCLNKLKVELKLREDLKEEHEAIKKKILEKDKLIMEARLNDAISNREDMDEGLISGLLHTGARMAGFYTFVVQADNVFDETAREYLRKKKEDCFGTGSILFFNSRNNRECIVIITSGDMDLDSQTIISSIRSKFITFVNNTAEKSRGLAVAGVSDFHRALSELPRSYTEAKYAMNYRLIGGWMKTYEYNDVQNCTLYNLKFDAEAEKILSLNIKNINAGAAKEQIKKVFSCVKGNTGLSLNNIDDVCSRITILLNSILKDLNTESMQNNTYPYFEKHDLQEFDSIDEILEGFFSCIDGLCAAIAGKRRNVNLTLIDDIKNFISQNYSCEISLEDLAKNRYFVNYSYLSRLFKSETGVCFSRYLFEIRMRKAKKLIQEGRLNLSEIADMVGYNDLSHFIKYFKKYYGETPGQYKNKKSIIA